MSLHQQRPAPAPDGTPMFSGRADRVREDGIAAQLRSAWAVELWHMPGLSFVDYLAVRAGRPAGWVEVVSRSQSLAALDALGGVALKAATWQTLRDLDAVPLSTDWRGALMVWSLAGVLWWVRIGTARTPRTSVLTDPRGAPGDVGEPVVLFRAAALRRLP